MAGGINAKNLAVVTVGAVFMYSGIKGLKISTTARDLISGKDPSKEATQLPITSSGSVTSPGTPGVTTTGDASPLPTLSGIKGDAQQTQAALSSFIHAGPNGQIPAQTQPLDSGPRINNTFIVLMLHYLKAPVTAANVAFLKAWSEREGDGGQNNPFNTTYRGNLSGLTNYSYAPNIPNYVNIRQGAWATAQTLLTGDYDDLVAALRSGTASVNGTYAGLHVWSGSYSTLAS
jgi:hypothetical protein